MPALDSMLYGVIADAVGRWLIIGWRGPYVSTFKPLVAMELSFFTLDIYTRGEVANHF